MAYLNRVMLMGNVGKDPEIRANPTNGRKVVRFSVATTKRFRDNNGEQKEQTDWHNIVGWGKIADIIEQLGVRKGTSLYVEGSLTNRSWTDPNGQKRYSTEVNMDTFQLLGPRQQQNGQTNGNNGSPSYQHEYQQQQMEDDEDLPF